jgi:HEAT repeat protein
MGQTADRRYAGVLRHMVRDPDPLVRRNALRSLSRINLACAAE